MMMFFYLLCIIVIPSVIAYPDGAPSEACSDMKPHHDDHKSEPANEGFYLLGEVFNGTYIPGKKYQSKNILSIECTLLIAFSS